MQKLTLLDVLDKNYSAIQEGRKLLLFDPKVDLSKARTAYFDQETGCKCAIGIALNIEVISRLLSDSLLPYQSLSVLVRRGIIQVEKSEAVILSYIQLAHDGIMGDLKGIANPESLKEKIEEGRERYRNMINQLMVATYQ